MLSVAFGIMGHPSRAQWIKELTGELMIPLGITLPPLPCPIKANWCPGVTLDERSEGCWPTARRALLTASRPKDCTHFVLIQDDAIPCSAFVDEACRAIAHRPDAPIISFFARHRDDFNPLPKTSWIEVDCCDTALAICIRQDLIADFVGWADRHVIATTADDHRYSMWLLWTNRKAYFTVPSLIDHRPGESLLGHPPGRKATMFAGTNNRDPIDWNIRLLDPPSHHVHPKSRFAEWYRDPSIVPAIQPSSNTDPDMLFSIPGCDVRLSIRIMAHPARAPMVNDLRARLGAEVPVVWDMDDRGCWPTAARAWSNLNPQATHHLVIQDDAVVCRGFIVAAIQAIAGVLDRDAPLFSFYGRFYGKEAWEAAKPGPWLCYDSCDTGVAVAMRMDHATRFVKWANANVIQRCKSYDYRLSMYLLRHHADAYFSVPSLADHVGEKSLMGHDIPNRRADFFVGVQQNGANMKWTPPSTGIPRFQLHAEARYAEFYKT